MFVVGCVCSLFGFSVSGGCLVFGVRYSLFAVRWYWLLMSCCAVGCKIWCCRLVIRFWLLFIVSCVLSSLVVVYCCLLCCPLMLIV